MLCGPVADLVEFDALIHLLAEGLSCRAVGRMEGSVVTICAASPSHLAVTVGTGEAGIEYDLLKPLAVPALEISDKGIVSFPVREGIFLEILTWVQK